MNSWQITRLKPGHPGWPMQMERRLGSRSPAALDALGSIEVLAAPKVALFCSARCPGGALFAAYDRAAHWRDTGRCVISGFHSPVEKECLRILLRGPQPIVVCPARGLPRRIPAEWKQPVAAGRMLILSAFPESTARVTSALAARRNEFVAALADEVWFAYIMPGGQMEQLAVHVAGRPAATPT